jgi:methionine synthase I (cobalamin-dependent)
MDRYELNDRLTAIAQDAGIDTDGEGVDETLNELTHIVADALGIRCES